ncbi:hypothetical protein IDJ75_05775 [Mucilaginibacter rigui]|uniref:DUF2007 domain-containing protein n=1 Tax=Mucilaginibacter rigui TaxID=534635 RepID=A0ABR7X2F1_9SPHI|nr:hypothetical protein [Mucilaginibacter rigui]MBD1384778.1 hypothetical protein [Mucilaginibacter rigui]
MLKIDTAQAGFVGNVLQNYNLPAPTGGFDTEVNGSLILLFEDEQEAVAYLDVLEDQANKVADNSPEKAFLNALIVAINNDEFVQAYLQ